MTSVLLYTFAIDYKLLHFAHFYAQLFLAQVIIFEGQRVKYYMNLF